MFFFNILNVDASNHFKTTNNIDEISIVVHCGCYKTKAVLIAENVAPRGNIKV